MNRLELRLMGSFFTWYLVFQLVILVGQTALLLMVGTTIPIGAAGVVVSAAPAISTGKLYYKRMSALPDPRFSWRMAAYFTAASTGFDFFMLFITTGEFNNIRNFIVLTVSDVLVFGAAVLGLLIHLVLTRFFFSSGAQREQKRQVKQHGQDQSFEA